MTRTIKYFFTYPIFVLLSLTLYCSNNDRVDTKDTEDTEDTKDTQKYKVTFKATWSASTHDPFPSGPHFSGLVGAVHNDSASFWERGKVASDGIESMAETGSKSLLLNEVKSAISSGTAKYELSGGGIGRSPGEVSLNFTLTDSFTYVTLVSMLAPSPDWFVGVSKLNLKEDTGYIEKKVELKVYDAGTDSGTSFTAANADTSPAQAISRLSESGFANGIPIVGTFHFVKVE